MVETTGDGGWAVWTGPRFPVPESADLVARLGRGDLGDVHAVVFWGGVAAREGVCVASLALSYLDLVQRESCGRCGPCRIGTEIMRRSLRALLDGTGTPRDVGLLREFAERIEDSAWCGVANTIREPILGLLEVGAAHFAAHAAGRTCPPEKADGWMTAPCRSTCPSTVDCPSYIFQVMEEHPHIASGIVRRDNPLPATIGRTCHHPCESNCTLVGTGQPIAINFLKRWAADRDEGLVDTSHDRGLAGGAGAGTVGVVTLPAGPDELAEAPGVTPELPTYATSGAAVEGAGAASVGAGTEAGAAPGADFAVHTGGGRVAIVGAGPAGLSAAYYLARRGYRPVIYEALPVPGGMLYVGIPEYRLPESVLRREVELIQREGVEIRYDQAVGRDLDFAGLLDEYPAAFIAIGAHSGKKLRIPGEELPGSMDAIEFLRMVALGQPVTIGERVLVIGGGNSAMDAARTSVRLGAKEVTVVYRRAREQMPANPWEIEEAEEEGVVFHLLAAPVSCEGDVCVLGLVCQPMELGPPDESGRRSPVPMSDCEPFVLDADTIIAAVGQAPDFSPFVEGTDLTLNKWGYLECDPATLMTSRPGVFVGGDAVSGGASVIEAIWAGKTVAKYADLHLRGLPVVEDAADRVKRIAVYLGAQKAVEHLLPGGDYGCREEMPMLPPEARRTSFDQTELGFSTWQAHGEAQRCLRCHRPIVVSFGGA